jgi:hypothetical protein
MSKAPMFIHPLSLYRISQKINAPAPSGRKRPKNKAPLNSNLVTQIEKELT